MIRKNCLRVKAFNDGVHKGKITMDDINYDQIENKIQYEMDRIQESSETLFGEQEWELSLFPKPENQRQNLEEGRLKLRYLSKTEVPADNTAGYSELSVKDSVVLEGGMKEISGESYPDLQNMKTEYEELVSELDSRFPASELHSPEWKTLLEKAGGQKYARYAESMELLKEKGENE